jgi:hypothetical protein
MFDTKSTCRRRRRAADAEAAVLLQLEHVRAELALDAMVLADELGLPLAAAGDAELAGVLADAAMWAAFADAAADALTLARLRELRSEIEPEHIARFAVSLVPGVDAHLLAVGASPARRAAVERAAAGIERIVGRARPPALGAVPLAPREHGVRWVIGHGM